MEEAQRRLIDIQIDQEIWNRQQLEREEYLTKLKKWLDDARLWHYNTTSTGRPYNNSNENIGDAIQQQQQQQRFTNIYPSLLQANLWNANLQNILRQRFPNVPNDNVAGNRNVVRPPFYQTSNRSSPQPNVPPSNYEFVIPPLWKRMVAEFMDFLILFLVKMALTFLLLESFDIIDMEFYGFESFQKNLENPEVAMPIAMELLTLELLHRLIVCAYETYFLKGKFCATPGKRYMGLMVINVESISPVPGRASETVTAADAKTLGWQKSLMRAALKNLFVGLFLPLCVAFYIFPHNRTSYDMMSNSIVVEYHQEFMVYNSAI